MSDYVIVYADVDYGQREAWSVPYTYSVIAKKSEIDKAKEKLVQMLTSGDSDTDPSEIEFVDVPAIFLEP